MMDWPLRHTFTSTSGTPINKIAETYSFLFFPRFPLAPDPSCDIIHPIFVTHNNGAQKPTDDVLIQCLRETLAHAIDPVYIRTLIGHHADTNTQTDTGDTLIQIAIYRARINIARILLDNGADPNSRGNDQSTPLHHALYNSDLEIAHLFLERGADVDAVDYLGNTAYQIALENGHKELAQLLLGHAVEKKT